MDATAIDYVVKRYYMDAKFSSTTVHRLSWRGAR